MDPFVGRDGELATLRDHAHQARSGSPRVVLIEGEAGFGKTALIRRFVDEIPDAWVLRASGDEDESSVGGGILDQLARSADITEWGPLSTGGATDPVGAGTMLLDLIGRADAATPIVLICDDAHWADLPSLRALAFTFRRLVAERLLAVLAFRPEGSSRVPEGIHRLTERNVGSRMILPGLETSDVRALARSRGAGDLSPREAERLREHTGGNPLHLTSLLKELDSDTLRGPPGETLPAPRSFHGLVLAQLARLSAPTQELVIAASVLGTRAKLAEAAQIGSVSHPVSSLEEATLSGLVQSSGMGADQSIVFAHPLVRAAVYHDQGPAQRARLHARAAALSPDEATVLRHREAAAHGPDQRLADQFVDFARRRAEAGDVGRAGRAFASAGRLHPDRQRRERLVVEAAATSTAVRSKSPSRSATRLRLLKTQPAVHTCCRIRIRSPVVRQR